MLKGTPKSHTEKSFPLPLSQNWAARRGTNSSHTSPTSAQPTGYCAGVELRAQQQLRLRQTTGPPKCQSGPANESA